MADLYTPMQIQALLDISASGLRIYTDKYPNQLSTEATGKRRKFNESDLCFLSYVKTRTDAGDKHDEVLASLKTDEGKAQWQQFSDSWKPPTSTQKVTVDADSVVTALVPIERLVAVQAVLQSEREAFQRAEEERQRLLEREAELSERLERTHRELGEALGELKAIKQQRRKPPRWWVTLFGGGE